MRKPLPPAGVIWALRAQSRKKSPKKSSRGLSAPGPKKSKTESKKSQIIQKQSILGLFRLRFGLSGPAPTLRGPGNSISDSSTSVASPRNPKAFVCVCPILLAFACVCTSPSARVCQRLSAFEPDRIYPHPLGSRYLRPTTQMQSFLFDRKNLEKRLKPWTETMVLDHGLNFGLPRGEGRSCPSHLVSICLRLLTFAYAPLLCRPPLRASAEWRHLCGSEKNTFVVVMTVFLQRQPYLLLKQDCPVKALCHWAPEDYTTNSPRAFWCNRGEIYSAILV